MLATEPTPVVKLECELQLLYVVPPGCTASSSTLYRQLKTLECDYRGRVTVDAVDPEALPDSISSPATAIPWLLILRNGEVVAEALGDSLPIRELDTSIRRALEAPVA